METLDWLVLITTLAFIVGYGVWKTRGSRDVQDFLKGRGSRWWTVGLSVMATQASAITFLSTPGQAYNDGMGFVQFYFGLPIAMVVIILVFIPIYHRLNIYTAYEFLESRFDLKTRTLTAGLFLIQRGLAAGITIFAPAIVLSAVLGWPLTALNIAIGLLVIIYTVSGGTRAVNVTQKQQMAVIFAGMIAAFVIIVKSLPENISFGNALDIAGASGKMDVIDFSFNFENRYTFWSGVIGGAFLALSYFGTDQSQVQRYLAGKSVQQSQMGLIMNGILKIPMQFFILLTGVMVFVFYQFNPSPLNFNPVAEDRVMQSENGMRYQSTEAELGQIFSLKKQAVENFVAAETHPDREVFKEEIAHLNLREAENREAARGLIEDTVPEVENNDRDYIFIHFILHNLPRGLIGLLLAVILSAAMSSTASELNALAATTTVDLYRRNKKIRKSEKHYLVATKWFTLLWGILAIAFASVAHLYENLIQLVNIIGSIFYGNVLGIFLLAFFVKWVRGTEVFTAAIITQVVVIAGWYWDWMPFLWLNVFGCALVMGLALVFSAIRLHR